MLERYTKNTFSSGLLRATFLCLLVLACVFAQAQGAWTQKANFGGTARRGAVGFSVNGKGYMGLGIDAAGPLSFQNDMWEYDPGANTWTQVANFPGAPRAWASSFSIGNFGYIATGYDSVRYFRDVWEYDPAGNSWLEKNSIVEDSTAYSAAFSVNNKGYIGTGIGTAGYVKSFWEHEPAGNSTVLSNFFGGSSREGALGFASTTKGYITTGKDSSGYRNDLWQYDPSLNSWTQKANFPGIPREKAVGFAVGNKGYVGTGINGTFSMNDFWQYDAGMNVWSSLAAFPASSRSEAAGFSIGSNGYVGTGVDGGGVNNDFWEFAPPCLLINTASTNVFCNGDSDGTATALPYSGNPAYSYMWRPVLQTTQTATGLPTGTYTVIVTDASACSDSAVVSIFQPNILSITSASNPASDCFTTCDGSAAAITSGGTTPYTYSWNTGATTSVITGLCAGTFTVFSTDAHGCWDSMVIVVNCLTNVKDEAGNENISVQYSSGILHLQMQELSAGNAQISIYNVEGKEIYRNDLAVSTASTVMQIDLSDKAKGIYFVRFSSGDRVIGKKFLVD